MSSDEISFGSASNYQDLLGLFRDADSSDDGRISKEELRRATGARKKAANELYRRFDTDRNGKLELHEVMGAVNWVKGSTTLFNNEHIERVKAGYGLTEKAGVPDEFRIESVDAASELREKGFTDDEIVMLFDTLKSSEDLEETVNALIPAIDALKSIDPSGRLIIPFLIEVSALSRNPNGALAALPACLNSLRNVKMSPKEKLDFLQDLAKTAVQVSRQAFQAVPSLLGLGLSPKEILDFASETIRHTRSGKSDLSHPAFNKLPNMIQALRQRGIGRVQIRHYLTELLDTAGPRVGEAYRLVAVSSRSLAATNFDEWKKKIDSLLETFGTNISPLIDLAEGSGLNPTDIQDRDTLVDWVENAVLGVAAKVPEEDRWGFYNQAAELLNQFHDRDPFLGRPDPQDYLRKSIIDRLVSRSIPVTYEFLANSGNSLYTSGFLAFYDRLMQEPDLLAQIQKSDPDRKLLKEFIIACAGFNRLLPIYEKAPDFFNPTLLELLNEKDPEAMMRNLSTLDGVIGEILTNPKYASFKPALEKRLIDNYLEARSSHRKSHDPLDRERQLAYGFLIKYHYNDIGAARKKAVIQDKLPEIKPPKIPATWLDDGALRAKLYFYEDELPHFALIQSEYQKKGFTIEPSGDKKTVAMWKEVNGLRLEVTITLRHGDIEQVMADDSIDIVGHRGHSFHLEETFQTIPQGRNRKKLIYAGSCGSWRSVPNLMKSYQGNFFISDEDKGRGMDNNNTLYYTMEAIANGETDWSSIQGYVASRFQVEGTGLVFPDAPSMLLYEFVASNERPQRREAA